MLCGGNFLQIGKTLRQDGGFSIASGKPQGEIDTLTQFKANIGSY